MTETTITDKKSIYYPPGGILIWFLILLEIFTFLGGIFAFLLYRKDALEEFKQAQALLNPLVGTINTLVLITSGYFMANSIHQLKDGKNLQSKKSTQIAMLLGILFLIIKSVEFYGKISSGIGFTHNTFFTFYWLMTGFHYVHVLFGVGLLAYMQKAISNEKYNAKNMFDVESSATYWHLCDLIWILIFPILYLL
ncbi:MAG: cytochrome c oxidase subunit 3 [Flavobacteriales bacterium]|nr:cytochrome c oxidase subunit 3 [Flavobacteriales bacterium]MBX2959791.1 cytochrome c oxidase subunit 3 [Flavobacteriales bacterium]HRN42247.1 cytochrome c oxidase subunit 3 [Vicingus sp.]HRP59645.1 cytochrome c oxidase subunit 3 [Vicingus sp.]